MGDHDESLAHKPNDDNLAVPQTKMRRFWREWVRPIGLIVILCCSFRSAVADWNDVPTGSMEPTILVGDRILVNKLAYALRFPFSTWRLVEWAQPQRGEVVVFFGPEKGVRMVKRVVGEPGDEVLLRDDRLFINGKPAAYQPLDEKVFEGIAEPERKSSLFLRESVEQRGHPVMFLPRVQSRRNFGPITVPPGQFFVMGDNRDNSRDSRWFGCIKKSAIVGKSFAVAASFDPSHYYLPRWNRFFLPMP